ncbi:uncharacterized protein BJ171DRAFT_618721 [Polychytrium aggregatum]|uniref:uncharacterized protein n=1 Tax=Polychytrium aggregatum TaxID=110093 RepID=UPI0022FEDCA2|nr:uncharacterized protein BJ171DRAFT_618721 [Polychytrium aggregatum]KAI9204630.1 hypothetical protein BJ171DRAFT_618721 [Polychytrium aggregatum]
MIADSQPRPCRPGALQQLPGEVVCHILSEFPVDERLRLSADIEVSANATLARVGMQRFANRFPRLQSISIKLQDLSEIHMENAVSFAQAFRGHPSLAHIDSCTSAVLLGIRNCPGLVSLKINEDYVMPVPHLLRMNGLEAVFRHVPRLRHLELNSPLLWAVDGFSHWDDQDYDDSVAGDELDLDSDDGNSSPMSCNPSVNLESLQSLVIRGLHSQSLRDFSFGWLRRTRLSSIRSLSLSADDHTELPRHAIKWIRLAYPQLETLCLEFISLERDDIADLFTRFRHSGLRMIALVGCELPSHELFELTSWTMGEIAAKSQNLVSSVVEMLTTNIPSLTSIELRNCSFRQGLIESVGTEAEIEVQAEAVAADAGIVDCRLVKLESLQLLGLGRGLPLKEPVFRGLPNLSVLRIDEASGGAGEEERLWNMLCEHCPLLQTLDIRFTRFRQQHIPNATGGQESALKHPATLTYLEELSLYAPHSVGFAQHILQSNRGLKRLKLNYLSVPSRDTCGSPDDHLGDACAGHDLGNEIHLPDLQELTLHTHGPDSEQAVKRLATLIAKHSSRLSILNIQATRSVTAALGVTARTDPAQDGVALDDTDEEENLDHITTLVQLGVDLLPPEAQINGVFVKELANACPRLAVWKISGIGLTRDGLAEIASSASWRSSLRELEIKAKGVAHLDGDYDQALRCLVRTHFALHRLTLTVASLSQKDGFLSQLPIVRHLIEATSQELRSGARDTEGFVESMDRTRRAIAKAYAAELANEARLASNRSVWGLSVIVESPSLRTQLIRRRLLGRIRASRMHVAFDHSAE